MGDSQGNPFIGNPFMQKGRKKPPADPDVSPQSQNKSPTDLSLATPEKLSKSPAVAPPQNSAKPTAKKVSKSLSKPKATAKTTKTRSSSAKKNTSPPSTPTPSASYTGNGYKVQVLAKIPMPTNTNMPSRDYLWFAVYPIIPRVGDCIFHDGRYFRVDAVFLYENTNAGWCADLEVSYYTRRH
ncbi:hypothetical protein Lepto7375DRAFT_3717 [Leptolyngbya sp. PCC 7375]|nr:hypothetical protein Lepto7375DRAFT_3717 [Leptolyngbya sp. PCC 7375]